MEIIQNDFNFPEKNQYSLQSILILILHCVDFSIELNILQFTITQRRKVSYHKRNA